ncbi:MAG: hypothetical protein A2Y81_01620 [Nitrospirae bacterium RBG_13_43_8]|nr:MAG: hypothetical protein A2Y81_01620 [Nitrospirae bacterium RBG_13_43_8]
MLQGKKSLFFFLLIFFISCPFTASMAAAAYSITVIAGPGGKITPDTTTVTAGMNKTFSITPYKGYHVAEVKLNGVTIFQDATELSVPNDGASPPSPADPDLQRSGTSKVYKYFFKNIQQDQSLEAVFKVDTFALEIFKVGQGTGSVESTPANVSCGTDCMGIFPYNTEVVLTSTSDDGALFDGWSGKCKGRGATCTVKMTKASIVTANFARAFKLSVSVHGSGAVTSSPKGILCEESCSTQVKENSTVKLKAKAASYSKFLSWTGCTTISGSTCTVAMNEAQHVAVAFAPKNVPLYALDFNDLPESIILQAPLTIPKRNGAFAHCYLESFSVQMAYIDSTVSMEEVFTFAGLGAVLTYDSWGKGFLQSPPKNWTWPLNQRAMQNYGVSFITGHSPGIASGYLEGAFAKVTHANGDEALRNLKAVIRSGRPVQVHIDLAYLLPELGLQPGASHFIIITGYDADGVYWTDPEPDYIDFPLDRSEYVNVKIPLENFMRAWEEAGKINKGAFTYCAPYWMLFLEETAASQIKRILVNDILSLQRSLAQNNASVIERNLSSDFSGTHWERIALAKRLFSDYLKKNGYPEAANVYEFLAGEYNDCGELGLSLEEKKHRLNDIIKPLEMEARTLF